MQDVISFPVDAVTDTYGTFLPDGTALQFQQILSLSVLEVPKWVGWTG
ncbi:hypothetical protein HanXRQr2_Chr13g0618181 [Helianthus annuus]|uniref:Uncharacterized protein n=1 Tax=Helianthus annuus TaxID=4232 RepID=A0A9K3EMB0_HELAN|nr:hypothetical protein HanXRQr2_Chr13g0618181 [Helianthus annuus]